MPSDPVSSASDPTAAERRLEEIWKAAATVSPSRPSDDGGDDDEMFVAREDDGDGDRDRGRSRSDFRERALTETSELLGRELEALIQSGLTAFHAQDAAARDLSEARHLSESREREVRRLQESEEQSREAVSVCFLFMRNDSSTRRMALLLDLFLVKFLNGAPSCRYQALSKILLRPFSFDHPSPPQRKKNLLRAVESAKSDARDASRAAQVEARLRSEITSLRLERDGALASAADSRRKVSLLEEEAQLTKTRLSRMIQEKVRMERDSRAAMSLARSLDSHSSSDTDFYKHKVGRARWIDWSSL